MGKKTGREGEARGWEGRGGLTPFGESGSASVLISSYITTKDKYTTTILAYY